MEPSKVKKWASRKRPHVEHMVDLSEMNLPIPDEIEKLFNKRFTFQKLADQPWCLAGVGEVSTKESERLQALKESLNDVKNQLSDKELEKWHEHTAFTNRAGKVIPVVRSTMNAELCTQAWCKFHEILCTFPLLPFEALQNGELNSVHLCEAPGAFIASLNHYLKSHRIPCDWNWIANTLNPYHEGNDTGMMIMDDRLIAATLPWWYFGPDNTGDIMAHECLQGLKELTQNMKVHLVTADGSFDCQDNPGEQETLVSPLHYCETIAALMLLSPKGSFVLKMFTLFERCSVCLLYLLNCCFREVSVFKPGTSKSGNSEVYVVCLEYKGKDAVGRYLDQLGMSFGPDVVQKSDLIRTAVPESFLKQLEECCFFFHKCQTDTIRENLLLFGKMGTEEVKAMEEKRDCAADFYLRRFQLRRVAREDWLVKRSQAGWSLAGRLSAHKKKKLHSGSYNDRMDLAGLAWQERMSKSPLGPEVNQHCTATRETDCALRDSQGGTDCQSWYILEGRRLSRLVSSPFCDVELQRIMEEAALECGAARGTVTLPCDSCSVYSEELVLSELAALMAEQRPGGFCDHRGQLVDCLVMMRLQQFPTPKKMNGFQLRYWNATSPLPTRCTVLHDGELSYQQCLLDSVLHAIEDCRDGGALILPILSSFTRFTAGLLFVLQHCFRALDFVCPTSSDALGTLAVLLCAGFRRPPADVTAFLARLSERVRQLQDCEPDQPLQVLQFVPMELLLRGNLPRFLDVLNTAILKQRLHLLTWSTT
ncbi:cap-specific mRNA (nucleoside-2'-O-)-methyltransferase 2 [Hemiscyllium ocellatum]|uniref:cap-specific mRNA (nucleoside-2'-O-)-methyltransferase 2 n=1 Tax=Hemiscyllium ocellatum TaxID=170820 RepID=UPI0029669234|nr:cap-specific mRNA (nucleoside-2'-O-)-methyltransferase 2 [Hemiscyllium ocellatum]XP_060694283.1 cap-specific mRNA (nucleoside-2'-O-)-methyltransferase 2 [Hemiscyllium ocellatum]